VDPKVEDLGGEMLQLQRSPLNKIYEIFLSSIEMLANFAGQRGVRLLLENNPMDKRNTINGSNDLFLLCDLDDFQRFKKDFTHQNIGILLDVGHLKVSATNLNFDKNIAIEILAEKIEAFHLHDNNGFADQHLPFDENAWFLNMLSAFKDRAAFIIEANSIPEPAIKTQVEILAANLH
jgi:sugar phosphate isomerase/epimerase